MSNLPYLCLAARLKLWPNLTPPRATFAGVTFAVEPEHYQLRGLLKQRAIQPVLAQLLSLCDANTLFVDIGANVGIYSLLVSSETDAQVLAIEPVQSTFHALVRNCSLNPALPVTPLNLAIGASPEVVQMTSLPGSGINHVIPLAKLSRELHHQQAFQISLDQLHLRELAAGFGKIVIKIDVERHEFEVLTGMQSLLDSRIPMALCIEVDPENLLRLERCLPDHFRPFLPPYNQYCPVTHEPIQTDFLYANELWDSVR